MKKNMSSLDRILRVIIAVLVGVLYFLGVLPGVWAIVLGVLAVIFLLTGFIGFCPLYTLFGFSTQKKS